LDPDVCDWWARAGETPAQARTTIQEIILAYLLTEEVVEAEDLDDEDRQAR
jgi:hypothetical protein